MLRYLTGRIFGTDARSPRRLKHWMENAGFVEVEEHCLKIPVGPWARDPRLKMIGRFELVNMTEGIQGLTKRLLTRSFGWTSNQVELFLMSVRKDVMNSRIHSYYHLYAGSKRRNWCSGRADPRA